MQKLIYWFYKMFLQKRIWTGFDKSNGKDYSCDIKGYIDSQGKYHIIKTKFY